MQNQNYINVDRDLKPENLLMTSPDDEADLKLVDFGFAAVLAEGEQLRDPFGTVGYCSPEVIRQQPHGKNIVDPQLIIVAIIAVALKIVTLCSLFPQMIFTFR